MSHVIQCKFSLFTIISCDRNTHIKSFENGLIAKPSSLTWSAHMRCENHLDCCTHTRDLFSQQHHRQQTQCSLTSIPLLCRCSTRTGLVTKNLSSEQTRGCYKWNYIRLLKRENTIELNPPHRQFICVLALLNLSNVHDTCLIFSFNSAKCCKRLR